MANLITDDLGTLLDILPLEIRRPLNEQPDLSQLLEVIMDLGRVPEARFPQREIVLRPEEVTEADLDYVITRISVFGGDNRAGIERTLHRISAIRNRKGKIIGLTLRIGRAVLGTIKIIEDLIQTGSSVLLLGRPGVGKTTMLREVARVLADDLKKRVVIVDTSNEIAGDGDIPHPAIGRARRMQVAMPDAQHAVMIEAVENHMPEVIVIDEIGTELEAQAARTIAERGVQLVGTAHGNTLDNLMQNPTLSDLIGGIQAVTLGDEEARRRGTQKTVLERKAPPTFDIIVEIQERDRVAVHTNAAEAVDAILRGHPPETEVRSVDEAGEVKITRVEAEESRGEGRLKKTHIPAAPAPVETPRLYLFGINRTRLEEIAEEMHIKLNITERLTDAGMLVTSGNYFRRRPQRIRDAEARELPVYVLKSHTPAQFRQFLGMLSRHEPEQTGNSGGLNWALTEAEEAVSRVRSGAEGRVELSPQGAYIRRLQHLVAERNQLRSDSLGAEPRRRVNIFKE
ncbi:R3H domain-containing nucleic acid-binding protein [Dehalogenimonas sp. THU2]|uniref:R3H domain-containing nucleic acid-binding protein n=1 Tax=Dehalogenimonas sp. THU2 TaxID=3151121 RepID=UPI003218576D